MDLEKTIRELREEQARLERVIVSLEELAAVKNGAAAIRSRRGRKFMGAAERREVSERMKRYWAQRRQSR